MKTLLKAASLILAAVMLLLGCGGGGGGEGGISGTGIMRLSITDAPSCGYDTVFITVDRVRVNKSATASDGDAGWSEVQLTVPQRIDLLTLSNGVLFNLGQTSLPAGTYTQMRLLLAPNSGANPLANAVKPTGGTEVALTTPSAQQSGIKLNVNMAIAANTVADFAIDFDACKSIVKRGNSGQYNLKPVVTVIPIVASAGMRVVGYVDTSISVASTNVSLQSNGVPVKATVPDVDGKFELYPVPVGNYSLVVTAAGRVSAVMTGVPVVSSMPTTVNALTTPIAPPAATLRSVSGTVTPATATVRALQTLGAGPQVETSWGLVNADTGAFDFSLPIEAPVVAAYVANPVTLNFVANSAAAGHYTLEASSAGVVKTQAIDATQTVPPVSFSFP